MASRVTAASARAGSARRRFRPRVLSGALILACAVVALSGCLTKLIGYQRMWKVGATEQDYKRDDYVCSQETQQFLFSLMWRDCMEAHGWSRTEAEAAQAYAKIAVPVPSRATPSPDLSTKNVEVQQPTLRTAQEPAPALLGSQTLQYWATLPDDYRALWLAGALEVIAAARVTCPSGMTISDIEALMLSKRRTGQIGFVPAMLAVQYQLGCRIRDDSQIQAMFRVFFEPK